MSVEQLILFSQITMSPDDFIQSESNQTMTMIRKQSLQIIVCLFIGLMFTQVCRAQEPLNPASPVLTHWMTPEELLRRHEIGRGFTPTPPPPGPVVNIAEFNYNEGVLIRYPFGIPMTLIKEMSFVGKVTTIVANTTQQNTVHNQYTSNGVNISNCDYLIAPSNSYWTRDYGPWYVISGANEVGIVDFPYNRPRPADDDIPVKMAQHMSVPLYGMNVVHTGGNYMCDGMSGAASTTLVYTENPTVSQTEIHQRMNDYLGIANYHVRPDPNGTYIDHIDCWSKFLDVDKILVRAVPSTHPQYSQIESAAAYWQTAISSYGTPYQVFRVNTPNDQPYSNSFILKNKVFLPITGNATHDNAAIQVYQNAMPGYEIIGVYQNPSTPWESTDALHCRTHEVADKGMLYVRHFPVSGTQPSDEDYIVDAYINALSGYDLIADSMKVFYRVNNGSFLSVPLYLVSGNDYRAEIPRQAQGSTIGYYIQAMDMSGRSAFHPFIGPADPHLFTVGAGVHPHLLLSVHTIDTNSNPGALVQAQLTMTNTGYADLVYVITTDNNSTSWLSAGTGQGVLTPGNHTMVDVFLDASLLPVGQYEGIVYVQSNDPDLPLDSVMVYFDVVSGVGRPDAEMISGVKGYPNPFRAEVIIRFYMKAPDFVTADVYNSQGRLVCRLPGGYLPSGMNQFIWDGCDNQGIKLPEGMYIVKLSSSLETRHLKLLFSK